MATTSKLTLKTEVLGTPEGGSIQSDLVAVNSTGVRVAYETTVGTGVSSATTLSNPINARFMVLVPPTSNTNPYRVGMSTSETGIPLSSQGFAVFSIPPSTVASTYYLWTNTTRAISGMRALFY